MGLFSRKKVKDETIVAYDVTLTDGTHVSVVRSVDCLGDSCPRPQLMTKKAVREISSGQVVEIMIDNPSSVEALPPMCNELGVTHLETIKNPRCWKVYLRKD